MKTNGPCSSRRRRGATLILSMVVLMLITAFAGSMAVAIAQARKQSRIFQENAQAACLADAAVSRAVARLSSNPAYSGETWQIPTDQLDGKGPARVTIQAVPVEGGRDGRPSVRIQVRAELNGPLPAPTRSSREVHVRVGR